MKQRMSLRSNIVVENPIFWNCKYLNNEVGWDLGKPTPIFIDQEKSFKKKSHILVPGCGLGHDALYFAKKKHIVDALDFSKYAIDYIIDISSQKNIDINAINCDFFLLDDTFNMKYDYIVEYTFYCAINPSKRLLYAKKCFDLLKNKGVLKGLFLPLNIETCNNPPYHVTLDEIKNIFSHYFDILKIDTEINSIDKRLGNEVYIEMIKK